MPSAKPPRNLTPVLCQRLQAEMLKACEAVAARHGLVVEPRDITGASLGGPKKVTFNTELIAPFPGAGNDRTLRLFTFLDVGNVYGEEEKLRMSELRASVGVGLSWISPLGPLRLAYAQPVRKFAGDRIQKLQFQIGTSF